MSVSAVAAVSLLKPRRRAQESGKDAGTFAISPRSPDEDLDWLRGRDRRQVQPERTRVMPNPSASAPAPPQSQAPVPFARSQPVPRPCNPDRHRQPAARLADPAGQAGLEPTALEALANSDTQSGTPSGCC